jgi:hypothetical protein
LGRKAKRPGTTPLESRERVAQLSEWSDEETDDPLIADHRNFYKVEKWTRDGMKVDSLLYAGNNLSKAQEIFANAIKQSEPPITRIDGTPKKIAIRTSP